MLTRAWKAYLEITLKIDAADRVAAAQVYSKYKAPILKSIPGSSSKELDVRDDDVQVLHSFKTRDLAEPCLKSELFNKDAVTALTPLLKAQPEVRIDSSN
ncbi:MAG: hypothetical protein A2580_05895 [Hydrogenophilales bacterium RIFOXYD1_FULL_62_11]|nr:MAG: hypothetical protein A2580_05895 [Hydrogenophilales bacterium RIFOXYD1_FULL_62_11]